MQGLFKDLWQTPSWLAGVAFGADVEEDATTEREGERNCCTAGQGKVQNLHYAAISMAVKKLKDDLDL